MHGYIFVFHSLKKKKNSPPNCRSGVLGSREIYLFRMFHSPKRVRFFINERGSPRRVKPIRPADGAHLQQTVVGSSASHVLRHQSYSESSVTLKLWSQRNIDQ